MNRKIGIIAAAVLGLTVSFAQTAAPKPAASGLPTTAQLEASLQRTLGYDSGLKWEILEVRPAAIPGISADVLVSLNKQPPVHLYVASNGENAIIGELIPFGVNPFAHDRAKLQAADGPSRGAQRPTIMIVGFSDLQCPHCKAAEPTLEKLVSDFPQVKYVFQQFPLPASLHPWAMKAAQYADCAGRSSGDDYWKYIGGIFENQDTISLDNADAKLKELATAAGLNAEKVAACAATPETAARIKKSVELGKSLDVTSTPTVFINGRKVVSLANIPYDQLKALVQFEIDYAGK